MRAKAIMLDGNLQNKVCHTLSNNVSKMTQTLFMVKQERFFGYTVEFN